MCVCVYVFVVVVYKILDLVYGNVSEKHVSCIRIVKTEREKLPVHSEHDTELRSVIPRICMVVSEFGIRACHIKKQVCSWALRVHAGSHGHKKNVQLRDVWLKRLDWKKKNTANNSNKTTTTTTTTNKQTNKEEEEKKNKRMGLP